MNLSDIQPWTLAGSGLCTGEDADPISEELT